MGATMDGVGRVLVERARELASLTRAWEDVQRSRRGALVLREVSPAG